MRFEFAKYTEVTDFAFKVNPDYKTSNYERIFICPDSNDFWLARILKGYGEDYEIKEGSYILERDKISHIRGQRMNMSRLRKILKEDSFENWDYTIEDSIEDIIEKLDGGFGINNLKD